MTMTATVSNLDRLSALYSAGFQDSFLDNALHKIVERQILRDEADLMRINATMTQFEQQYGFTSESFWLRFQQGTMADTADFMEWSILYKMWQRIHTRLTILRDGDSYE